MPLDFDLNRELEKRGGSRGGRGDFSWEAVRVAEDKDYYLGHSVMAPQGRWQKNRDIHFYSRDKTTTEEDERRKEIKRVKRAEEDALSTALGFAPVARPLSDSEDETGPKAIEDGTGESKEERRARREERRARKEERRRAREAKDARRRDRHGSADRRDDDRYRRDDDRPRREDDRSRRDSRDRSRSPPRHRESRRRSRSPPPRRPASPDPPATGPNGRMDDRNAAFEARRAAIAARDRR